MTRHVNISDIFPFSLVESGRYGTRELRQHVLRERCRAAPEQHTGAAPLLPARQQDVREAARARLSAEGTFGTRSGPAVFEAASRAVHSLRSGSHGFVERLLQTRFCCRFLSAC